MKTYAPVTEAVLDALKTIVGAEYVLTEPEKLEQYQTDEETDPRKFHLPEAVVLPKDAQEIAAVIKLANTYDVPVTVRSGGTSLAGGAIPVCGGIVLLMERLNKIIELNAEGMYMEVEAGVRTVDIQKYANEAGFLYAGDPCSADSCLIGGNIATNAGGNKAVRYGTTRDQKKSTGYCLEQLIMGSEGTLGIITKATLKLLPLCPYKLDLLAIFTDLDKAVGLVPNLIKAGLNPTSVEFMDNAFVRSSSDYCELKLPHYEDGFYVIVTVETFNEDELESKMEQLDEICSASGATDVLEADDRVWKLRRNCLESTRVLSLVSTSDDLVVPVDQIANCIRHLTKVAENYSFKLFTLAHAGDGNLHFQILKGEMSDEQWEDEVSRFHAEAYPYVYSLGGRLSGEHGIGAKKVEAMEKYTEPVEMKMMKEIKRALDPKNILNPGKVFNA